jgi:hypothetical protein
MAFVTGLVCVVFWPGQLDPDSLDEIGEARSGQYTDIHTPILSALWRGPYLLGFRSPGWLLALSVFTLLIGLYLLFLIRLPRPAAVGLAVLCLAFPPILGWAVHVGRDAWFIALLACAFGFTARATRVQGRSRKACLIAAIAFGFLAAASRQNAAPALVVLFCGLATLIMTRWSGRRRAAAVLAGGFVATLLLLVVQQGIQSAVLHVQSTPSLGAGIFVFDLALMSEHEGKVLLPPDVYSGDLATLTELVTPQGTDNLFFGPKARVNAFMNESQNASLRRAWVSAVTHHPIEYAHERLRVGARLVAWNADPFWVFQYPPAPPGYEPKFPDLNKTALDYLKVFTDNHNNAFGGPFERGWAYLVVLIGSSVWFLRRRPADIFLSLFSISLVLYSVVEVFVISEAIYRYIYPAVVAGSVMTILLVIDVGTIARRRVMSLPHDQVSGGVPAAVCDEEEEVETAEIAIPAEVTGLVRDCRA